MPTTKTEEDLLRLLHSEEITFVERKTVGDTRDFAKTIVAFANSLLHDQEGVLFIGATKLGRSKHIIRALMTCRGSFPKKRRASIRQCI
jgi:predicted HTH transcriptional regulator